MMGNSSYHIKLTQFEGPLDLLLHLIQKAKIDLQDIFVSEITEQYLTYMQEIEEVDMERASDFLNMAALLLYIKSRSLLPAKKSEEDDEEFIDPEQELIVRLHAYQLYKEASLKMREMADGAGNVFYKLPEELFDGEAELTILDADADALYEAFLTILKNRKDRTNEMEQAVEIRNDSYSIRRQKTKLLDRLRTAGKLSFYDMFESTAGRMEVAVTFVALLELWHAGNVKVSQRSFLKGITIIYNGDGNIE